MVSKTKDFTFFLNVSDQNLNWIDLEPIGFKPSRINLENFSQVKNQDIRVIWEIRGSQSGISSITGQTYSVNVTLINGTINGTEIIGEVLKEVNMDFIVDSAGLVNLSFDYDFRYGDYLIVLDLDYKNNITETDSSGTVSEYNKIIWPLPVVVHGCFYNETDNSMYFYPLFVIFDILVKNEIL